ncbi:MAG: hypothetical protein FWF82_01795 [Oscillospiraceae bacterium]|nr:hypothetical protein [Oscillospiraceae bacterium]
MNLTEWINEFHEENESLDIFLQIVCLLRESGEGRGSISPALYEVDSLNNVTFTGKDRSFNESDESVNELFKAFKAPEMLSGNSAESEIAKSPKSQRLSQSTILEKSDVFSLGLLLYYLLNREILPVNKHTGFFSNPFSKSRKKSLEFSAVMAENSNPSSLLMQRMTCYEPESRPYLKEVLSALSAGICKFSVVPVNVRTGERYPLISRSFSGSAMYKFVPEKEYTFAGVTISPESEAAVLVPFRLIQKQYILGVVYGGKERWQCPDNTRKKGEAASLLPEPALTEDTEGIPKSAAALLFCDTVYGIKGDSIFCETDGYTYEIGYYEHKSPNHEQSVRKEIAMIREGSIAVPERLEARILSILRENEKTINDLFCVAVYSDYGGSLSPDVVKAMNDMLPEAIRIYQLEDDDLLRGTALYLGHNTVSC